mmetsp:Transcript_117961/g.263781  ORF Transcript_117961/g.263781 Transcript_117961/m.263781 type:complete len:490 (-) Transcript_117961:83-1552(-)
MTSLPSLPTPAGSLEAQSDLLHFLRVARPEWSVPRRNGHSDAAQVVRKLCAIGIADTESLLLRISENRLNDDLERNGYIPLTKESIDAIKKQRPFMQALEITDVPQVRQVGKLAPASQLLSNRRLKGKSPAPGPNAAPLPGLRSTTHSEGFFAGPSSRLGAVDLASWGMLGADGGVCRMRLRDAKPKDGRSGQGAGNQRVEGDSEGALGASLGSTLKLPAPSSPSSPLGASMGRGLGVTWSDGCLGIPEMASSPGAASSGALLGSSMRLTKGSLGVTWSDGFLQPRGPGGSQARPSTAAELEKLHAEGVAMSRGRDGAKWICRTTKSLLQQGEEMLKEQTALDEREVLVRTGAVRPYITENIKSRLREEEKRGNASTLNAAQQCTNVRKMLNSMANNRRELAGLRTRMLQCVGEEGEETSLLRGQFGSTERRQHASLRGGSRSSAVVATGSGAGEGSSSSSKEEPQIKDEELRANGKTQYRQRVHGCKD